MNLDHNNVLGDYVCGEEGLWKASRNRPKWNNLPVDVFSLQLFSLMIQHDCRSFSLSLNLSISQFFFLSLSLQLATYEHLFVYVFIYISIYNI